ncbi:MAG TPA: glycosyltransferase family 39 protein [Solirubrobacteraceae bacterium]|nr:glycosyltransferase family 39 protein [Solirubrobacteraceae bacterium]
MLNIDHGLPWVYHADEAYHFTNRAVGIAGGDLNPHYFQNPSAYTYLLAALLQVRFAGHLVARYADDPTAVFVAARVVAALLCMLGVAAVYAVGRRLWGTAAGLAAAAILSFAFLPVAYSRLAVTDVGAFFPIALAAYAIVRVQEAGGRAWLIGAGVAIGAAVGFKYTAGLLVVPLGVAAWLAHRAGRARVSDVAWAAGAAALAFLVTTPFFLLDLHIALSQLKAQARAADLPKVGQSQGGGPGFYLHTLTWGLGWGALAAAIAGAALELRRNPTRAVLLALFPILLLLYISTAGRYFARWLMPAYPLLALFGGVAIARVAALAGPRPALRALVVTALLAAVLAQPVAADLRTARLLGREDTREATLRFLEHALPGARLVVEPAVPAGWPGGGFRVGFGPPPKTPRNRASGPTRFIRDLSPARVDAYRRAGFCTVVSFSLLRDRALADPRPRVRRYYRRLARESRVVFRASPYRPGAQPVPFDFDFSTHLYYPRAYERPGPDVTVYRLRGCPAPGPVS